MKNVITETLTREQQSGTDCYWATSVLRRSSHLIHGLVSVKYNQPEKNITFESA